MGLGPAIFGLCFYLSHVHLDEQMVAVITTTNKFNIVHPPSISHGNVTEIPTLMAPSVTVSNSPQTLLHTFHKQIIHNEIHYVLIT